MSLAETAVLAVELKLNGAQSFKTGISEADAASASLGRTAASTGNILGGTASNMSLVKQAAVSTGAAIKGMGTHFKNVITGPLGLIGLTAGMFSLGAALEQGVTKASDMGFAVEKLQGLTGGTADKLSELLVVFEKFGITSDKTVQIVGFAEKALGRLSTTLNKDGSTKLQQFDRQYGLTLADAKGHALAFGVVLGRLADFYNSNAPASSKAAAAAQILGRGYAQLIPILKLGSKGIQEAEQSAKDLGLTLTVQNAKDLKDYRDSWRKVNEAIGGVQLQLGLVFIPLIKDLADSVTNFLEHGGRDQLVTFFKGMAQSAREAGTVLATQVIPTLQGLASTAKAFWGSIPAPLRDLLFKGIVADRTIHFLFGVSPIKLGLSLAGDVLGPILAKIGGGFLQKGGSPANPLWVASVNGGLPGGGPPGGGPGLLEDAASVGGLSAAAFAQFVVLAAVPIIPLVAAYFTAGGAAGIAAKDYTGRQATAAARGLDPRNVPYTPTPGYADWLAQQRKTQRGRGSQDDMENRRGGIGDALSNAELVKTLPKHITALQHALVGATGKNATHIANEIKAEKAALKKALDALHPRDMGKGSQGDMEGRRGGIGDALSKAENLPKLLANSLSGLERLASGKGGFVPTAKLDPTQITDLRKAAKSTDIEAMRGKIAAGLASAQRATSTAGSGIVGAIRANRPITNVTVNVSATTVQHTTTVVTRYGPTGGTRTTGKGFE